MGGDRKKVALYTPGSGPSPGTDSAGNLIWISQSPEVWEINICCLSYPVYGVLLQQPKQTNTHQKLENQEAGAGVYSILSAGPGNNWEGSGSMFLHFFLWSPSHLSLLNNTLVTNDINLYKTFPASPQGYEPFCHCCNSTLYHPQIKKWRVLLP